MKDDTYYLMCKDSPILKDHYLSGGDRFVTGSSIYICDGLNDPEDDAVFLPYQEYWQELSLREGKCIEPEYFGMLLYFIQWLKYEEKRMEFYDKEPFYPSMTIAWCAFYHREKHNLRFNYKSLKWKIIKT